ncbi:endonuclease [Bacteroidia bacterium]|nr:endonuclease [Bacteroidia bacterium]
MSYNVENLFDTYNDTLTNDDEFTPRGTKYWSQKRYVDKLLFLSKVLKEIGIGKKKEFELPAIIGLIEVENRRVLEDLTQKTLLADGDYGIVHQDSPDPRGIDVALLYRKSNYTPLNEQFLPVKFGNRRPVTRDILYSSGILAGKDTVHFFVCHFPSMIGGEAGSEWKREAAATVLKRQVDSLLRRNSRAAIVIMGDLNGTADRPAQTKVLGTQTSDAKKINDTCLYNCGYYLLNQNRGSYKYQSNWQTIDHIIVSGSLLNKHNRLRIDKHSQIYSADFIMEEDKRYFGFKPFRTYAGMKYLGGYSDHLPIYIDIK